MIALVIICARFAFAYPSWYDPVKGIGFKPGIPDFYQHQDWGFKGWCWPTAFVNSLFYWDKSGYDNLFTETPDAWSDDKIKAGKWTDDMIKDMKTNIKKTAEDMITDNKSMTEILKDRGHPQDKLPLYVTRYEWDGDAATGKVNSYDESRKYRGETKYSSMFQLYKDELLRCEDILIRLIDPDPAAPNWWWSDSGPRNFHMLTGVGIEFKTCQETEGIIWFADPNDTYNDPHDSDWDRNVPDSGFNDPYKVGDELPFGQKYYDWAKIGKDGTIFDSSKGGYKGAKISRIYTISPVPEPATLFLLGSGFVGIIGFGRKKLLSKRKNV